MGSYILTVERTTSQSPIWTSCFITMSDEQKLRSALQQAEKQIIEKEKACAEERMRVQGFLKKMDESWKTKLVVKAMAHASKKADSHASVEQTKESLKEIEKETACPEERERIRSFIEKETIESEEYVRVQGWRKGERQKYLEEGRRLSEAF